MGFFKNLMNKITGGGAKVSLQITDSKLREPITVKISATVSDADLKINKIYVNVRAVEHCRVKNISVSNGSSTNVQDVLGTEETFRQEFTIEGAQTLNANQTYEWSKQIVLPNGVQPTFLGRNAQHEWEFIAGLDVAGNDPDSGWIKVNLS